MSRVGKYPVNFDKQVQVTVSPDNVVTVKGSKQTESVKVRPEIKVQIVDGKVVLTRKDDTNTSKSLHGLYRALVNNAVVGVSEGFTKTLELNGVGYRANVAGQMLELTLGYSHPIKFPIPKGIEIKVEKQTSISVKGSNRELVGQVSAKIRSFRSPEPYLGKGVKYTDETIRRKAGKSGAK